MGNTNGAPNSARRIAIAIVTPNESKEKRNIFSKLFKKNESSAPWIRVIENVSRKKMSRYYKLDVELGRGSSGTIYLCHHLKTKKEYACKIISKEKLTTEQSIRDVNREVQIMRNLPSHPNIVSLKDVYEDKENIYIIMELCKGGNLNQFIRARGYFGQKQAAFIFKNVVEVLQFCHQNGVMHRDLKPENFLLQENTEYATLKMADFGFSTYFKKGEIFEDFVGSLSYLAPEVIRRNHGPEADVWSIGVILYVLLSGDYPFGADDWKITFKRIVREDVKFDKEPWKNVSNSAKDLIRKILVRDPKKRLTTEQILAHPWLVKRTSRVRVSKLHV